MKIRIKGNAVRFRLSKPEVDLFAAEGYLEEETAFINSTFTYAVQKLFDGKSLDASFTDQKLTLFVPSKIMHQWTTTDITGFNYDLPVGEGKILSLLLEKDFKCVDGEVTEDQSDYYDNPVKSC